MRSAATDRTFLARNRLRSGFTLIELLVVVIIIGLASSLFIVKSGTYSYWQQESFFRKLTDTMEFLFYQAIEDGEFYRLEIDFETNSYRVGVLKPEEREEDEKLVQIASDAGSLSLELAAFLNPSLGRTQTLIPPPSFPSLFEPAFAPAGVVFEDARTMRGVKRRTVDRGAYILFSPRGFSEFAVLHLSTIAQTPLTILTNPFTGITQTFRDYRDFEWTYGRAKSGE